MKKIVSILIISLFAFVPAKKKITIWMIGDSTMAKKDPRTFPETGWGMEFQPFFDADATVNDLALNGRSTKSFLNEGHWKPVMENMKEGDYVIIEFGHNDEKVEKPTVGVSLDSFGILLTKYVVETRSKGGIPILMTPVTRRSFKDGVLVDSHGGYPGVTMHVADSLKVPLINMLAKSKAVVSSMGDEASKGLYNYVDSGNVNYPKGKKDDTHFRPAGAKRMAELAVEGIKELKLPLAEYLKK
jgi:pectinesterase